MGGKMEQCRITLQLWAGAQDHPGTRCRGATECANLGENIKASMLKCWLFLFIYFIYIFFNSFIYLINFLELCTSLFSKKGTATLKLKPILKKKSLWRLKGLSTIWLLQVTYGQLNWPNSLASWYQVTSGGRKHKNLPHFKRNSCAFQSLKAMGWM